MRCANMRDVEWTVNRIAEAGILGDKETSALNAACLIIAQLRRVLDYSPSFVTTEDVIDLIFRRTGGEL